MGYTSYKTKTNKTKTQHRKQRVNLVLTIQRNWLHGIHKLQDEDKQNKNTTQKTESQSSIDSTEKLATWDTQVTRRRNMVNLVLQYRETGYMDTSYKTKTNKTKTQHRKQRVNQELTIQRNWLHGIHKLQDEDKQNKQNTTQKTESQSSINQRESYITQVTEKLVNLVLHGMRYTSYKTKTNKTKTQHRKQRVNQELTILRYTNRKQRNKN